MKKNVLIFGAIAGVIVASFMIFSINFWHESASYNARLWLGYGSMIVAFAFIFVGVKNFRDKYNGGVITFGKAFKVGLYIALLGSTIYVAAWLIDYYCFIPDFMDKFAANAITKLQSSGATIAEINKQKAQMAGYVQMYKNPLMVIVLSYIEVLPVSLVIALLAALILKRRDAGAVTVPAV